MLQHYKNRYAYMYISVYIYIYVYIYIFKLPVYIFSYTNIGREFLNLISKHFPKNHQYSKIFNKNNMKVCYSCTDNLQTIIRNTTEKSSRQARHPPRKINATADTCQDLSLNN